MKTILLFGVTLLTTLSLHAQLAIDWQKSLGGSALDVPRSFVQTSDGGYVIAGSSYSNDGDILNNIGESDIWIVKLSSVGTQEWQVSLGGSQNDIARSIHPTSDGGFIVSGATASNDGDVSSNQGDYDYWIVKLTNLGVIQWEKTYGGSGSDMAESALETSDGGYIVSGISNSNDGDITTSYGDNDYWIIKVSSTGAIEWEKNLGGSGADEARNILQTSDGGYIVCGESNSTDGDITASKGDLDYWVVKLTAQGNIDWEKSYGGSDIDQAKKIQQTSDGGYIVTGFSNSTNGDITNPFLYGDYWLVKLSSTGNIVWEKTFGGNNLDLSYSIRQTASDKYMIAGFSASNDGNISSAQGNYDCWVAILDSTGNIEWKHSYGGSGDDIAYDFIRTSDGGYCILASSESNDGDLSQNNGNQDYWILKLFLSSAEISENSEASDVTIFPNPTSSLLNVQTDEQVNEVCIYTVSGTLVQKAYSSVFSVEQLSPGIYVLDIETNLGKQIKRFIKE